MQKSNVKILDAIQHLGARNTIAAALSIILALAVIAVVFSSLYSSVKDGIWLQGKLNAREAGKEFEEYLTMATDVVKMDAFEVNKLIGEKASQAEILAYMTKRTVNIQHTLNPDFTGLYGWINEEYLDGASWIPPADYVPTERPWYVETMAQNKEIVYVKPYLDLDTGTVAMTIGSCLKDGGSVLALDIPLDRLQEITEDLASTAKGSIAMVLDNDGGVVAHSDKSQLGKQYNDETDTMGALIAHKLFDEGKTQFDLSYKGVNYMVYGQKLASGWYSVSAINADKALRTTQTIRVLGLLIMVLTACVIFAVFVSITKRELTTRNLTMELSTIADIYVTVYDIDLIHDSFHKIASREDIAIAVGPYTDHAQETLLNTLEQFADESSKPIIREFADLSSLEERLKGHISITEEFLGIHKEWCRARFIAAERAVDGKLLHVLWLVESIDSEKRRSDELLRLSETDRMTGLYNRVSGENRIINMIEEGVGGMFLILDADKFKSINDTYGHRTGDEVLIAIAGALKTTSRSGDIIMRLGGDEFAVFGPGITTVEVGDRVLSRLKDALKNNHIDALGEQEISVSIGASFCVDGVGITFRQLYERADSCMYESKRAGGQRVTYYGH